MFRDSSDSALTAGWATTRKSGCGEDGESVEDLLVKTLVLVVEVLALPVMTVYNLTYSEPAVSTLVLANASRDSTASAAAARSGNSYRVGLSTEKDLEKRVSGLGKSLDIIR